MIRKFSLLTLLIALLVPSIAAQDDDKPTVAMMGFGWFPSFEVTEGAIFDMLQSYGFISNEENAILESRQDLVGENIDLFWVDYGRGRDDLNLAIEDALDKEPDVLLTLGSWLTAAAINVTLDMDDPPPILFASVNYPYRAGIAGSPLHQTGSRYWIRVADTLRICDVAAENTEARSGENRYALQFQRRQQQLGHRTDHRNSGRVRD